MQNYVNTSLLTQQYFIKFIELKNCSLPPIFIRFLKKENNNEYLQFTKITQKLSKIFICSVSEIKYNVVDNYNFIDENNSDDQKLQEFPSMLSEEEKQIELENQESVSLFIQYLSLKDQFVSFHYSLSDCQYGNYLKQLRLLEDIFKKKIEIQEIARAKIENDNETTNMNYELLNNLRRSYKSRRQQQRKQINNSIQLFHQQVDSSDTKENSQQQNSYSPNDCKYSFELSLINFIETSSIYHQFGSTFIGDKEFQQLFKGSEHQCCESEYDVENVNNLILFDSTIGKKVDLSSNNWIKPSFNYEIKKPDIDQEYQRYFRDIIKDKIKTKIYYIDAIGKSFTVFSQNLIFYTNADHAFQEFKQNDNGYLIQFVTSLEFSHTQLKECQIRFEQNNRVLPQLIIHQI